ncbi:unnamed protein product [Nezara viridula]|uniref:Vacuolar protein sorting-associated protein 52 homolog n=1 Tax=Nezara viridula TaxID=85310 RepID=A0A9P0GWB9_NEZVI|nr:unnamed protein product [Nezara viridula]
MAKDSVNNAEVLECYLEDEEVQEVLKAGTDLREYSRQIERQLKDVENKSIQNYIKESQNIVSLHNQINACDKILERMESMLLSFQSDLGSISNEIVYLQKKSIIMSQQLHNRQAVRGQLSQFIDDMAVPEALIKGILDKPVTDKDFLNQLSVLNHKISFVKEQGFKEVKSCQDVKDILEKLKIKAVTKIRAYLLEQISKFRKPMANYQIPQRGILKYKFFFEFALTNERAVAQEICGSYVDTMGKIYYSYFKYYSSLLSKLMYETQASKDDLMGIEETGRGGLFSKASLRQKNTVFTIGNRGDVLTSLLEAPIIVPHAEQKTEKRYPYEALFRCEQYALVDNACREFHFISEFFIVKGNAAFDLFSQIMGKTLALLIKNVENYTGTCYDTISLFLCAQLVLRYRLLCHKHAVPALDAYWDELLEILWPRFEYVFRLNIHSIKECDPTKFNKETKPHYIARRYAEFSGALVSLSESYPNELVSRLLAQLLEEVECFIFRMAAIFSNRQQQLVFHINNYDMILSTLLERTRDNCREAERMKQLLATYSSEYAEEVLSPSFGGIIQFVKEYETLADKQDELRKLESKALVLVDSFLSSWKAGIESVNKEIVGCFPNLVTGSSLVQLALATLLQYYDRFTKILSPAAKAKAVNIHQIKVEIKKYKNSFS